MKCAAIIMECNPFHDGHQAIIHKAKEITGADYLVVVMSGDFVQRGEPAILPKETRVRDILSAGAGLVIELPLPYATGGADYFARGAIALLSRLNVVTDLVFGSGSGNINELSAIAEILTNEPLSYREAFRKSISSGAPYPTARAAALQAAAGLAMPEDANDILGIEYLKALCIPAAPTLPHGTGTGSAPQITPHAIRRESEDSASRIRRTMLAENPVAMSPDTFSLPLLYKLRTDLCQGSSCLSRYADVSEDLAARIAKLLPDYRGFSQFTSLVKTRSYTYTRISRALLHILLNITREDLQSYESEGLVGYARVLGFRRETGAALMHEIAARASIPLITNLASALRTASIKPASIKPNSSSRDSTAATDDSTTPGLSPLFRQMLEKDIAASELYDLFAVQTQKQFSATHAEIETGATVKVTPELSKRIIIL